MGFWAVRKLVLAEDGTIDIATSVFVAWAIRILAVMMILQVLLLPTSLSDLSVVIPCIDSHSKLQLPFVNVSRVLWTRCWQQEL